MYGELMSQVEEMKIYVLVNEDVNQRIMILGHRPPGIDKISTIWIILRQHGVQRFRVLRKQRAQFMSQGAKL